MSVLGRIGSGWRRLERAHDAVFVARWRRGLRREARREQDVLRALVLLESLGVDNPVAYETLDLLPYLVADVHAWHQRMGAERFGDPGVCC
ncbi:cory-CC-star protein [Saccharomonospora xinjiangensis]|uniref:cory-CC-star protein n=1 Tax=Saccharomonospora xinjiangensis TaxID=75294 RepID=UPI00350EF8AA